MLAKRKISHSQVGTSDWGDITNELNSAVLAIDKIHVPAGGRASIDPFDWTRIVRAGDEVTLSEEQQWKLYLEYVQRNIGAVLTKKKLCVLGVDKKSLLLNVNVPGRKGRDIEFSGTTDLLILGDIVKKDPSSVPLLPGVQMLIEVKEEVKPRSNFQALSELVALDLRTKNPVMALLTDFNESWVFYWVAEKKNESVVIHRAFIDNPSEGFQVIRMILDKSSAGIDAPQIELSYFEHPVNGDFPRSRR
ncbi:hypothetical protein V7S43_009799 [Phytophthora oleae]|uniref:Restriction endonuclease n=1 Tax=Phytophthora oleae TaxID=2107226 RepID=A0ABD3FI00_9STRA